MTGSEALAIFNKNLSGLKERDMIRDYHISKVHCVKSTSWAAEIGDIDMLIDIQLWPNPVLKHIDVAISVGNDEII